MHKRQSSCLSGRALDSLAEDSGFNPQLVPILTIKTYIYQGGFDSPWYVDPPKFELNNTKMGQPY